MAYRYFKEHKLRWNNNGMFFVEGLKSVTVESLDEAMYSPLTSVIPMIAAQED